jgi:hypothetical protein
MKARNDGPLKTFDGFSTIAIRAKTPQSRPAISSQTCLEPVPPSSKELVGKRRSGPMIASVFNSFMGSVAPIEELTQIFFEIDLLLRLDVENVLLISIGNSRP